MARNRHGRGDPGLIRTCAIVLAATVLAVLFLPLSAELIGVAVIVAVMALVVWGRERARRDNRYQSASDTSLDNSTDYTYTNAFDGGASSTFNEASDDSRGCRFDSSFDSSSSSFDSGSSSDSGSSDCGGSGGD